MTSLRIVHYLNQFFAGLGGEDQAWVGPSVREGAVGPGLLLQEAMGATGSVVATVTCGDNYFSHDTDHAVRQILSDIGRYEPDVVVAGPAFDAGRYGLACGRIAAETTARLGRPAVTAMHVENPGVELFRAETFILRAPGTAAGMRETIVRLAAFAGKLGSGEPIGPAAVEGYFPRGIRKNVIAGAPIASRAVGMLLARLHGATFETEIAAGRLEPPPPAAPLVDPRCARIALVTESGLVPKGNPDRLPGSRCSRWIALDVEHLSGLAASAFESVHAGFDVRWANQAPDRIVPLDAARSLEQAGEFQELYPRVLVTAGNVGTVADMRAIGKAMAAELRGAKVQGVILTAT